MSDFSLCEKPSKRQWIKPVQPRVGADADAAHRAPRPAHAGGVDGDRALRANWKLRLIGGVKSDFYYVTVLRRLWRARFELWQVAAGQQLAVAIDLPNRRHLSRENLAGITIQRHFGGLANGHVFQIFL